MNDDIDIQSLLIKAQNGCLESRNNILLKNIDIIDIVIKKYSKFFRDNSAVRFGAIKGIFKGVQNYKTDKKISLRKYLVYSAFCYVKGELINEFLIKPRTYGWKGPRTKDKFSYQICGKIHGDLNYFYSDKKEDKWENLNEDIFLYSSEIYEDDYLENRLKELKVSITDSFERDILNIWWTQEYGGYKRIAKKYNYTPANTRERMMKLRKKITHAMICERIRNKNDQKLSKLYYQGLR